MWKWIVGLFIGCTLLIGVGAVAHVGAAPYQTGAYYPYLPIYWGHSYYRPWVPTPWSSPYEHYVYVSGGYTPWGTIDRRYTYDPVNRVMYNPQRVAVVPQRTVINYIRPANTSVPPPSTLKTSVPCCAGQSGGTGTGTAVQNKPATTTGQNNGTGGGSAATNKAPAPSTAPVAAPKPAAPAPAPKPASAPISAPSRSR